MAGHRKEYQLAIKIHGEMSKSLPAAAKLSKSELRAIAKEAAHTSKSMKMDLRDGLKSTEKMFSSIERVGVKAFKTMAKVSGTAFAAIGAGAVKVGSEYEAQMSTVKAISGVGQADIKALSDEAKNLGATTVFTAKEAGQAMEYEAMAGWKAGQMIKGTAGIMNLAAASGEDLASTADIVTDSLTAFNMKAKDSGHFSDVMAAAATNANTNVAKLGETFKYAAPLAGSSGFSVEDTALVAGTMANSGIKDSMAGTTIRSWITRMTKPTKESEAAMKKLGIRITDSKGEMKELSTIAEETRESFDGLSKKEKSRYAAMLAGKTGMSGLLALVNASEKDYRKLEKAIRKCDGAADEMAKIKLDNLEGDVKLFTSAMQGAGIEIYEEIKEPLRDVVQEATEWVGDFSKGFKTEFPTAIRMVREGADAIGDFAEPLLKVGGWLVEHPDVIVGTIAGIGTAVAGHKVVSGVTSLAGSLSALGPAGWTVLGVAGAATAIVGIGSAMKVSQKMAADANLKRHFGDVALSMEELDAAARQIVGSKKLERVEELMSSLDKGDAFVNSMKDAMETVNKTNWKVEAGLKLKKGEKAEYKAAVKSYVDNAQDYISQQGYTVSVATKVLLGDKGKDINLRNNEWYAGLEKEAKGLKRDLNKYIKKAMKDGLDIDEQRVIDNMLGDLNEITQAVADAQAQAKLDVIDAKYSGVDMNADSFQNLQKELNTYVEEANKGADEAYYQAMSSLNGQLNDKHITKKEYQDTKAEYQSALYESKANSTLKAYDFMMGKVQEKYGDSITPAIKAVQGTLYAHKDELAEYEKNGWDKTAYLKEFAQEALEKVNIDDDAKNAIRELMSDIVPTVNTLTGIQRQAVTSGVSLDAKTNERIDAASYTTKMTNAATGVVNYENWARDVSLGGIESYWDQISNMDDWKAMADEAGKIFSDELNGTTAKAEEANNKIRELYSAPCELEIHVKSDPVQDDLIRLTDSSSPFVPAALSQVNGGGEKKSGEKKDKVIPAEKHARGGIFSKPHLGLVAEAGIPESIIPIEPTKRSFSLWEQTGQMLGAASNNNEGSFRTYEKRLRKHAQSGLLDRVAGANSSGQTINITFSPNITIQGNADREAVQSGIRGGYQEFEQYMKRFIKNKGRMMLK